MSTQPCAELCSEPPRHEGLHCRSLDTSGRETETNRQINEYEETISDSNVFPEGNKTGGGEVSRFGRVAREGLSEQVTLDLRPKGGEGHL